MLQHIALNHIVRTAIILAVLLVCASGCGRGAWLAALALLARHSSHEPRLPGGLMVRWWR
jgi:hypothetical protein